MVRNQERLAHVQALRTHARSCGVAAVTTDGAARSLVKEMAERIRTSGGPAKTKREAEEIVRLYEETFQSPSDLPADAGASSPAPAAPPSAPPAATASGFRLRGRSFLFTHEQPKSPLSPGLPS